MLCHVLSWLAYLLALQLFLDSVLVPSLRSLRWESLASRSSSVSVAVVALYSLTLSLVSIHITALLLVQHARLSPGTTGANPMKTLENNMKISLLIHGFFMELDRM